MKERMFTIALIILMSIAISFPFTAMAFADEVLGDYTYEIISDDSVRLVKYNGDAEKLDIPLKLAGYSIVEIGERAFQGNLHLTSVSIPGEVRYVGDDAFSNCDNLKEVILKEGITDITGWGKDIFGEHWTRSTKDDPFISLTIPNSLSQFSFKPFSGLFQRENKKKFCIQSNHCIAKIIISPDNPYFMLKGNSLLTKDGKNLVCVVDSGALTSYTVPNGVETIDDHVLTSDIRLNSLSIPKGVTTIGKHAFSSCAYVTSLSIADSVETIENNAFNSFYSLKTLKIPKGVKTIGDEVFFGCAHITSITIPESVTSIGKGAFRACYRATKVTIPASIGVISDGLFAVCRGLTSVTIPDGITAIGSGSFGGCESLKKVSIPDSVTSIGDYAFESCVVLENLVLPESITFIGQNAFAACDKLTLTVAPGSYAEKYCMENGLRYVTQ